MNKLIIAIAFVVLLSACAKQELITYKSKTDNGMGKIIGLYGPYNAANVKAMADIPAQADMTVVGSSVDCNAITIAGVNAVIHSGSNTVTGVCQSINVNKWSYYGPYIMGVRDGAGEVAFTLRTPYSLGSFAGYNHDATPPVYYMLPYMTSMTAKKSNVFSVTFPVMLRVGDRYPDDIAARLNYVRVKAVIHDLTNSRDITIYSAIQAASNGYINHVLSFTDTSNVAISGSAHITAEYVSSDGYTIYGQVEGKHPDVPVSISAYSVITSYADFNIVTNWDDIRFVYTNGATGVNLLAASWTKYLHKDHSFSLGNVGQIWMIQQTTAFQIPSTYMGGNYIGMVILKSGVYYTYSMQEYIPGQFIDAVTEIPAGMPFAYKLTFGKTISGWPVNQSY